MPHVDAFEPVPFQQLFFFDVAFDKAAVVELAESADSDLLRYCDNVIRDLAERRGWTKKQWGDVRRSVRLAEVLQHTPGAKILASKVIKLTQFQSANVSITSALEALEAAGLLIDDRARPIERLFRRQFAGLPDEMLAQLQTWFSVVVDGSTTAPRSRPRDPQTARVRINAVAPAVRLWASEGHRSLAEISAEDIAAVLPGDGAARVFAEQGLRSLFRILKSRKLVFVNPTRGLPVTKHNRNIPLPLDTEAIREALDSPNPAAALAVALVAFHALAARQLQALLLTDVADGRLTVGDRSVPLAAPVLPRLSAWLDHRSRTWPASVNPYLFVSRKSASRLTPVGKQFPWKYVDLRPQTLREDRILDEVLASGGDVRRICELFGMSVDGVMRYTAVHASDAISEE